MYSCDISSEHDNQTQAKAYYWKYDYLGFNQYEEDVRQSEN